MLENQDVILAVGAQTLKQESEALAALAANLGDDFLRAVEIALKPGGRIAVCGMGKSGHVGRKIAATMASTGSPAYFLHPAEASHGDLGMLGKDDVLLAISNSGNTAELVPVLDFAKRHGIPIIGMTHNPQSQLGRQADVCLTIAYAGEACPIGCAPTTSTTATLAMGDALAMALLKARGFTAQDFNEYHPGGALGHRLLLVRSIMHTGEELPFVDPDARLSDILLEMTIKGFGCTGVRGEGGGLAGIITDGDLRRHMNSGRPMEQPASAIMTANPIVVEKDNPVSKAMNIMEKHAITSLFVLEDSKPVGLIHMHDCLKKGF